MALHIDLSQKLNKRFESCEPCDRALVQLLSVTFAPVSKNALLTAVRNCNAIPDGRSYNAVSLSQHLEKLSQSKLVQITREGVRCNANLMHAASLSAVADGNYRQLARAVQTEFPMVTEWGRTYYRTALQAVRDLRIAFYLGNTQDALETLEKYYRQYPYEADRCHPFVTVCNHPFDPAWFMSLPEPLMLTTLKEIISHADRDFAPADGAFLVLRELAQKNGLLQQLRDQYCRGALLRGRLKEAEQAAAEGASSAQLAALGWLALQRGECESAVEQFRAALVKLRKETGKRKTFFDDVTGPIFILALLRCGTSESLQDAFDYCEFVTGKKEWPYQDIYLVLRQVIKERQGERNVTRHLEILAMRLRRTQLAALFVTMALKWSHSSETGSFAKELPTLAHAIRGAGYHWLADELELTALACGFESSEGLAVKDRYHAEGLAPLHSMVEMVEPWQNALAALIRLNKKDQEPAPQKAAPQARLIWQVTQAHGTETQAWLEIQPREQRLLANGNWSAGRNVSLKRLAQETASFDYLTEQDVRICGCIKEQREGGYYYGGRAYFELDQDKAIPLMIGHQHVYLEGTPPVRLELVQGEPELQLVAEGDTLQILIHPPFEQHQMIFLLKESPTRIKVFEAKDEYKKIAAIVGTGLKLPSQAKDKALEAINSLSSILTVHSDIGSGSGETVEGDVTPCFHLLPYNAGLKVELLVRPFADAGPYFRPGAGGATVMAELDGRRVQAKRDLRAEVRRAADTVSSIEILSESEDADGEWLLPAPQDALELLLQLQALGDSIRVAWPEGARFKVRQEATSRNCRLTIRQAKDWFELEGEIKVNQGLALDLQQLIHLVKDGPGRFVQLGEGEFLALSKELRKRLDDLASFAEPHGKGFRFHPLASTMFQDFAEEAGELSADQHWQSQLKRLREAQAFRPRVPATLQAELRGYQEDGFCWLNRLSRWGVGACLADDMGLGKTVQALAQILAMAQDGPSLVIAPTSVCLNWESETVKFAPTLNVIMFGNVRREEALKALKPFDLVICSYGLLQQESELLSQVRWQAIVLDEAQAIKNMATKRSQAAMDLNGAFKMVATGTPIENHLGELWNVFRFINPGLLGSLKQFNVKFAAPIEKDQDKKARGRLKKLIQPFILRRTKNQVLEELPPRTEITVKVEMSEQEASFYEALRRSALETLAGVGKVEGKGETHLKILAEIMRLRRACCNPRLVLPESPIPSSKLAAFGEIIAELRENRHKALVFSQFVGHLEIVREYVEKGGIPYQYLDGSTPPKERKKRMDDFQSGHGDLFLISLKAGGVGLNLTAADYVIHLDPWWNPAVEDQASDRAHRIGQLRPVTIYRLVTKGTIEEKIVGLHQHKRGLADSLLEESDISGKITAEELLELLRKETNEPGEWRE